MTNDYKLTEEEKEKFKDVKDPFSQPEITKEDMRVESPEVEQREQECLSAAKNVVNEAKPLLKERILVDSNLSKDQKKDVVNFINDDKEIEKVLKNDVQGKKQDDMSPMGQFKQALTYFAPKIIGLVGGAIAGDLEAGVIAGEEGMKGAEAWRSYNKELEDRKIAKAQLENETVRKAGIERRAEEQLDLRKKDTARLEKKDERRFGLDKAKLALEERKLTTPKQEMKDRYKEAIRTTYGTNSKGETVPALFDRETGRYVDSVTKETLNNIKSGQAESVALKKAKLKYKISEDAEYTDTNNTHLANLDRTLDMLDDIKGFKKDVNTGFLSTRLQKAGKYFDIASDKFIDLDRAAGQLNSIIVNQLSGKAASDAERNLIKSWSVDLNQDDNALKRNIDNTIKEAKQYKEKYINRINKTKDKSMTKEGRKAITKETMDDINEKPVSNAGWKSRLEELRAKYRR